MSLIGMKPQTTNRINTERPTFWKWDETPRLRLYGSAVRRMIHYVQVEKADGNIQTLMLSCINYEYPELEEIKLMPSPMRTCPLDEVFDLQMEGKKHDELPFVSYKLPPASWGADAKPQRNVFQSNMLSINREIQKNSGISSAIGIISFKKSAWDKLLKLVPDSGDDGFSRGDPTCPDNGYDVLLRYHKQASGANRFEILPNQTNSPLIEEENEASQAYAEKFSLKDYYKVLDRDEILALCNEVHERVPTSASTFSPPAETKVEIGGESVSGEIEKLMKESSDELDNDEPPF